MTVIVQPGTDSNGKPQPIVYDTDTKKIIVDSNGYVLNGGQKLVNVPSKADYASTAKTQTLGWQEALDYADATLQNVKVAPATYLINEQINFMQHSYAILDGGGSTIKANASMTAILAVNYEFTLNPINPAIGWDQTIKNITFDGNGLAEYGLSIISGFGHLIENVRGTGTTSYWIYVNGTDYPGGIRIVNANDDSLSPGAGLYVNTGGGNILRLSNSSFNGNSNINSYFAFISHTLFKGLTISGNLFNFSGCYLYAVQSSNYTDSYSNYYIVLPTTTQVKFSGCVFDTDGAPTNHNIDIISANSGGTATASANTITVESCIFYISSAMVSSQNAYLFAVYGGSTGNLLITGKNNAIISASAGNVYTSPESFDFFFINVKFSNIELTSTGTINYAPPQPTTPAVPASGTAQENTNPYPVDVYLYGGTVTELQITKNGTAYTVFSNSTGLALSGQAYRLNPGDSITVTYTAAPSWEWLSD